MSSTDRAFRCVAILRCDLTREKLQARIATRLISRQSDILPPNYRPSHCKRRNILGIYLFTYTIIICRTCLLLSVCLSVCLRLDQIKTGFGKLDFRHKIRKKKMKYKCRPNETERNLHPCKREYLLLSIGKLKVKVKVKGIYN